MDYGAESGKYSVESGPDNWALFVSARARDIIRMIKRTEWMLT